MKLKFYMRLSIIFTSLLLFTCMVNAQSIYLEIPITNSWDDVEEVTDPNDGSEIQGEVDAGSSDLEMPFDHSGQIVGLLFRDVAIEKDQHIVSAYIQFTSDDDQQDTAVTIYIVGELAAQPDTIDVSELFNVSKRTRTTAQVTWDPDPWLVEGDANIEESTTDLKPILDEITSLDGWASGNRILFMLFNPVSAEDVIRKAESWDKYEGDPTNTAAVLHIELAPVGIENLNSEFVKLIYPNPTEGMLYIENPSTGKFSYEIFNISGELVASRQNIAGSMTEVNLSDLAEGVYLVNLITKDKTETLKVILE